MCNEKKLSKGYILALTLISLFIVAIIVCSFIFSENQYYISKSIITLLCLLVIIVLSNSFDNFSIFHIFTLKKEVKEHKEKIITLEKEKNEIFFHLLSNNQQNQNSNITFNNLTQNPQNITIDNQNDAEKATKEEEEIINQKELSSNKRLNNDKFESLILNKYFGLGMQEKIIRKVKVIEKFQDIDSISNKPVYFDAYMENNNLETFIDIKKETSIPLIFHDRLYVQINKILLYKSIKACNAQFILIITKDKDSVEKPRINMNDIEKYFKPAIHSGLLKVINLEYTKAEYESCLEERK